MQVRDFSVSFFMTIFFKFLRKINYLNEVNGWFEINCWYICLSTQSYLIVLWGFLQALLHWITESQGLEIALDNLAQPPTQWKSPFYNVPDRWSLSFCLNISHHQSSLLSETISSWLALNTTNFFFTDPKCVSGWLPVVIKNYWPDFFHFPPHLFRFIYLLIYTYTPQCAFCCHNIYVFILSGKLWRMHWLQQMYVREQCAGRLLRKPSDKNVSWKLRNKSDTQDPWEIPTWGPLSGHPFRLIL